MFSDILSRGGEKKKGNWDRGTRVIALHFISIGLGIFIPISNLRLREKRDPKYTNLCPAVHEDSPPSLIPGYESRGIQNRPSPVSCPLSSLIFIYPLQYPIRCPIMEVGIYPPITTEGGSEMYYFQLCAPPSHPQPTNIHPSLVPGDGKEGNQR